MARIATLARAIAHVGAVATAVASPSVKAQSNLSGTTAAVTTAPAIADLEAVAPVAGRWTYSAVAGASEASFLDSGGRSQLNLRCSRATRSIAIARPASGAAPYLQVWTSSMSRSLPASFTPANGLLTATLSAYDSVFDAMAMSRGRIGIAVSGQPPLVAPPWAELIRVVEDCRT